MASERRRTRAMFDRLVAARSAAFPPLGGKLNAPDAHGVYVIRDRKGTVLHVGRTVSGKRGLWRRLRDHLRGRSSFTLQYAIPNQIALRNGCCFQFLEVPNPRARALLESLAVGELCPKHVGDGSGGLAAAAWR